MLNIFFSCNGKKKKKKRGVSKKKERERRRTYSKIFHRLHTNIAELWVKTIFMA
jgi:hypothetical protein